MFDLSYHQKVVDDIALLGTKEKQHIRQAIETKLVVAPLQFGKPLQYSLSGLRALRVGDYRVVFKLQKSTIIVLLIAHCSVVYEATRKRL